MKNNKLIVVLGVHRSGTSVITRSLQVMGVELGNRMMPPTEDNNIKGFWEDVDLNALNIEMLSAVDTDWHHLASIEQIDVEMLRKNGYILRATELLRSKVAGTQVFGFKDPRIAKLLLFWKEVFSHCQFDANYILAVRHPLSVARSLAKRDGFDVEKGYLLWLGHVVTTLKGSAGDKWLLVDYDLLMQSPDHELGRIAKRLDLTIDPAELQRYKAEFLDQGLRHTVYELNDLMLDDTCPPLVREMYAALLDVASDKTQIDDPALQKKIEHWVTEVERLNTVLAFLDRLYTREIAATQAVSERGGQIASLTQAVGARDGEIASLTQAVVARDGQIANFKQALAERDGQIASLKQAVVARDGEIGNLTQAVAERDGQVTRLDQAMAERDEQIAGLNQAVAGRDQVIAVFRSSNSWRITEPLRFLSSLLSGKR